MTATNVSGLARARPRSITRFLHRHEGWRGFLLLAPALILMTVAILAPMGMTLMMSTWSVQGFDIIETPGLANYTAMANNPMFPVLIWRTLQIAMTCTIVTVVLVYPVAYFLAFHTGRGKAIWLLVLTLPFWTSYLLRVFAWRVVLGNEGAINSGLMSLGFISEPLSWLLYSQTAVTIVLAHSWAAFAIVPIFVSLEKINRTYLEAAADLGDTPARRFWRITLPLSMPGVVAAFIMMFVPTMGEYITPLMVGGPDSMMIGNLVQTMFGPMANWPAGAALSVVMMLTIGLASLVFVGLNRLVQR
ncbi:MAG: ABC transporter permease [Nitrospiraceae bacterium]|nr:ABC transporter permease [Nitrospiraceae bacterium]